MSANRCSMRLHAETRAEPLPQRRNIRARACALAVEFVGETDGVVHAVTLRSAKNFNSNAPTEAPAICATMKPGASAGRIPANVSERVRPRVIAGFANEVEAVNQYAAPIHADTRHAAAVTPGALNAMKTRPAVAITSDNHWPPPVRGWLDAWSRGSSNMA